MQIQILYISGNAEIATRKNPEAEIQQLQML